MLRFVSDVALLLSIFYLPWWVTLLMAAALFLLFPRFYELLIAGLCIDLLYSVPVVRLGGFEFVASLFSVALYCVLAFAKQRMRV